MEEKQAFHWTPEVEAAFQTVKESVSSALVSACSQPRQRFVVDTDMSNAGIGGVLSQIQDSK
jgi:hypothetical protein